MEVEALPHNWDGAGSSVHRGGARMWGDPSHTVHNAEGEVVFGGGSRKGESLSGHGWPRDPSRSGPSAGIDLEAAAWRHGWPRDASQSGAGPIIALVAAATV